MALGAESANRGLRARILEYEQDDSCTKDINKRQRMTGNVSVSVSVSKERVD